MVPGWNGTEWTSVGDMAYEGQNGEFFLVIESTNSEGYYNVSINTLPAVDADLAVSNLSCGTDMISNEELSYSFEIHNLRGPTSGEFMWTLELMNSNGEVIEVLDSSVESTFATYGQLVLGRASSTFLTDDSIATGVYACFVTVNIDEVFFETGMENNLLLGENFTIQNEEELWANDVDRDGYNTTDTGDGIVDACPEKNGKSTKDRYGCPDLDNDGWSNPSTLTNYTVDDGADWAPMDPSQWVDADEDGFGDNSSGYLGDQCPGVPGVENGEGGDGCPPPFVDTDGDGVQNSDDDCDSTPTGAVVDEKGCEVDTDAMEQSIHQTIVPRLIISINVDDKGCEITDSTEELTTTVNRQQRWN